MWEPQGVRDWTPRAGIFVWVTVSEEGNLEVRNKLKATTLSFSGHVDPFNLRAKAAGTCGAEA